MNDQHPVRIVSTMGVTEEQRSRILSVSSALTLLEVGPELSADALGRAHILLTHFRQTDFDPALAPHLRWVHLISASVERVFEQPIGQTDVILTNSSGIHAIPIAEYVLTSMLAFTRHFPELLRRQGRRHWSSSQEVYASLVSGELRGQTLGVAGYGSIGREVGRLARCLGMRVLALKHDPSSHADGGWRQPGVGDPDGTIPDAFFGPAALHEFLSRCDCVVLACPLTPQTAGMIDQAALRSMRRHAYLVNVARGQLIDEAALLRALREGWIAGAGLDVMSQEPLPTESEFFDLPNVILTPHCSGTTPYYNDRAAEVFRDNLLRYLAGEPLLNVIDRKRGY